MKRTKGSVPVLVAAKVYGKDPAWVRAGIISGYLPIGTATRDGKKIESLDELNSKRRINYYISPRLFYEHTGVKWNGEDKDTVDDADIHDRFITKSRLMELKYFCRQYKTWESELEMLKYGQVRSIDPGAIRSRNAFSDPTAKTAIAISYYKDRMQLVNESCKEVGAYSSIIFDAVTEGLSYNDILVKYGDIQKSEYDSAYRKFFKILHYKRG